MKNRNKQLLGKTIREPVLDSKKKTIVEAGTVITPEIITKLSNVSRNIQIVPYVSDEIEYMSQIWMRNILSLSKRTAR